MIKIENRIMRLLLGASLLLGVIIPADVSNSTFLFCLKPTDNPLQIKIYDDTFSVNNSKLDKILHDSGVVALEEWIPGASSNDSSGNIFLNRIYRAYVSKSENIKNIMELLNSQYSFLYIEHENIHKLHYEPNDPNYSQQCSISSIKADKAWDFWDIPSGVIPEGQQVLLASVDTGVDYTHPDLKETLWVNQLEIRDWAQEAGID